MINRSQVRNNEIALVRRQLAGKDPWLSMAASLPKPLFLSHLKNALTDKTQNHVLAVDEMNRFSFLSYDNETYKCSQKRS